MTTSEMIGAKAEVLYKERAFMDISTAIFRSKGSERNRGVTIGLSNG
jgi:hypothetical protein